jgi:hypothetical protein
LPITALLQGAGPSAVGVLFRRASAVRRVIRFRGGFGGALQGIPGFHRVAQGWDFWAGFDLFVDVMFVLVLARRYDTATTLLAGHFDFVPPDVPFVGDPWGSGPLRRFRQLTPLLR